MLYLKFVDAIDVNLKDPSSPLQPELCVKLKHQAEQRCAGLDGALLWTLKLAVKPPKPLSIMWEQLALEQAQKLLVITALVLLAVDSVESAVATVDVVVARLAAVEVRSAGPATLVEELTLAHQWWREEAAVWLAQLACLWLAEWLSRFEPLKKMMAC